MNGVMVLARKEIRQISRNHQLLISAALFAVIFGGISGPTILAAGGYGKGPGEMVQFTLLLVIGLLCGYILSSQTFLREKQDGTIETLLASPLPVKDIWLGKLVGVFVPSYVLTLCSAVLMYACVGILQDTPVALPPMAIIHVLTVVPAFIVCGIGLLGFIQLLLGMRENQVINILILFALIFLVSFSGELLGQGAAISPAMEALLFAVAVVLIVVIHWLAGFLDKEKIVRSIP